MANSLKEEVFEANMALWREKLVFFTWGNISGIDRQAGKIVIKASGIPYEEMTPESMCTVNLAGEILDGDLNPSSDLKTHLVLYRHFKDIGGVCHTHSHFATAWAQAGREIPCLGTTHADTFFGNIPLTRSLNRDEIKRDYETETGMVIVERFSDIDYWPRPAALVQGHGPFTWGKDAWQAFEHAAILEEVAALAYHTYGLNPDCRDINTHLLEKHYFRKHGNSATYGQNKRRKL